MRHVLQVPGQRQLSAIAGGVYIKHNVRSGSATLSEYSGSHRGVLLQLGEHQLCEQVDPYVEHPTDVGSSAEAACARLMLRSAADWAPAPGFIR